MAFEEFKLRGTASREKPTLSIWKSGFAGPNAVAIKEYDLNQYNYVTLYFDSNTKKIGFKFTEKIIHSGAKKISKDQSRHRYVFFIRFFLKNYNIDHSKAQAYNLTFDEESGLYVIQL